MSAKLTILQETLIDIYSLCGIIEKLIEVMILTFDKSLHTSKQILVAIQ